MKKLSSIFCLLAVTAACNNTPVPENTEQQPTTTGELKTELKDPSVEMIWETDTVLTTNESVYYDDENRLLYVSNIAGKPTEQDGTGWISKVNYDGSIQKLKWAEGLDAPKGMAILDGKLYVTNIDELVAIDLNDPQKRKAYPVKGAQFLNDVVALDGDIYFSDMNTGKLHVLNKGKVKTLRENMASINGVAAHDGNLYALDGEGLHMLDLQSMNKKTINSEVTGGDGLVVIDDNTFIASRWQGEIWLIDEGVATKMYDSKAEEIQTADIGYNAEEQIIYVPRFFANKVTAMQLRYPEGT